MENIELIGATGFLGFLVFVLRLMVKYQRDFTNEYAKDRDRLDKERDRLEEKIITNNARHAEEVGMLTGRVKAIEDERDQLRADLLDCTRFRGSLLAVLHEHGWSVPDDQ